MKCYIKRSSSGQFSWRVVELDETGETEEVVASGGGYESAEDAESGARSLFDGLILEKED
jgi:uncharacterized protein YegP (UPF0339 family)